MSGPPLVGRDRDLAETARAFARLRSGNGALFLLAGEPGIGKSRLATEVARTAVDAGVTPGWGRCWEAGGAPVFWPWREACASLGVRFPEGSEIAAQDPEEARFALFREVASALARAAAERPLAIILEDLHVADRSTLLLLEFVAGQLGRMPVLVIGTYRELEARLRGDLADSIARLGRIGRVLQLARLTAADVGALVRDGVEHADERLIASVFETTQGNPLFVDEIVRDIRAHGQRSGLPLGVREVIRQRLSLLSPGALTVLEACAVLGVELTRADVLRMLPESAADLDQAVDSGVLIVHGDRLRFSHALYRESLYYDLPTARRQNIHREAARSLALGSAPATELAHHLLDAGPAAIVEAVDHAIRAASQAAETFAFEDALTILERARAAIPPAAGQAELRCQVSIALGETKLKSGDATGRGACVEAIDAARSLGNAVLLARAGLAYGSVFLMGGVDPVLVGTLERALESLPDSDSALRAQVMARLAAARQPSPPNERARDIELGLAAVAMARRVADRRELLGVLHAVSGVLYGKAHPRVRLPIAREQEALAEEQGDTSRLLHALVRLAFDHLEQADFAAYAALAAKYEKLSVQIGPVSAPWRVALMRSMLAIAKDDFVESERWQAESLRLGVDDPRARRAQSFHRLGYLRAAERHGELRRAIPELQGLWLAMPYGAMLADLADARILSRIGADDEIARTLAAMPAAAIDEEINCSWLADAVWATANTSLAQRIEPLLEHLGERWPAYWFDCEIVDGPIGRAQAYVAAVQGRWEECERSFAGALAAVEAVGRRSLAARMRYELGDLQVRLGRDADRARELLAHGHREAKAVGLEELVAQIEKRHPWLETERVSSPLRVPASSARPAFGMTLEGEYYALPGASGATLRFKSSRGMQYLALLVERPNTEVHVLELAGALDHPDRGDAGELLDRTALHAYRSRLEALREELDTANALGNGERAARARDEMESIAAELNRSTQKGGRVRKGASVVDRARSAVQRRIKDALDRISERDPELGAWLKRSISTGTYCIYRPGA